MCSRLEIGYFPINKIYPSSKVGAEDDENSEERELVDAAADADVPSSMVVEFDSFWWWCWTELLCVVLQSARSRPE
jgi:hypothetical protein